MPSVDFVRELERHREDARAKVEAILVAAQAQGRTTLGEIDDPEFRSACQLYQDLETQVHEMREDLERAQLPKHLEHLRSGRHGAPQLGSPRPGIPNTAGRLAPLHMPNDEVRRLQTAAQRGDPCRIETRAFSTADSLIPAYLYPYPVEHIHENRLLEKLPGTAFDTPQITFIRHVSTTGAAAPTLEGGLKPELTFVTDALTLPASKIAGNVGLSYEIINDFDAFHQYAIVELQRQVVDQENQQLLSGSGTAPNMTGFFNTSGILTLDASTITGTNVTIWDALNVAINQLRVGPALAEGNLWVFHPADFNAIRRVKDAYGRFLMISGDSDTSDDLANKVWGIEVFQDIWCPQGKGLLIDTRKMGYVGVREPLITRVGYANDDLQRNILRFIAEERLTLCVTRPSAVLSITNLP